MPKTTSRQRRASELAKALGINYTAALRIIDGFAENPALVSILNLPGDTNEPLPAEIRKKLPYRVLAGPYIPGLNRCSPAPAPTKLFTIAPPKTQEKCAFLRGQLAEQYPDYNVPLPTPGQERVMAVRYTDADLSAPIPSRDAREHVKRTPGLAFGSTPDFIASLGVGEHLLITGNPGSGKTEAARTLLNSAKSKGWLTYAISDGYHDSEYAGLPDTDAKGLDMAESVVRELQGVVDERIAAMAAQNASRFDEVADPGSPILLVVDYLSHLLEPEEAPGLKEAEENEALWRERRKIVEENLQRSRVFQALHYLLKTAGRAGVSVAVTENTYLPRTIFASTARSDFDRQLLMGRVSPKERERLFLTLGLPVPDMAPNPPLGRGVLVSHEGTAPVQVWQTKYPEPNRTPAVEIPAPFTTDTMPRRVWFDFDTATSGPGLVLGTTGKTLVEIPVGGHTVISGAAGSGKTEATRTLLAYARAKGWKTAVCGAPGSAEDFADLLPTKRAFDLEGIEEVLFQTVDEVRGRARIMTEYQALRNEDLPESQQFDPILLAMDDLTALLTHEVPVAQELAERNEDLEAERERVLRDNTRRANIARMTAILLREGRSAGVTVVLAGQKPTRFLPPTDRSDIAYRVLLGPASALDRMAALRDPASAPALNIDAPPGRGIFEGPDKAVAVQVARYTYTALDSDDPGVSE